MLQQVFVLTKLGDSSGRRHFDQQRRTLAGFRSESDKSGVFLEDYHSPDHLISVVQIREKLSSVNPISSGFKTRTVFGL